MHDPVGAWRSARTFEALCALGARFIAGELEHFPGWGAPELDLESDALLPTLTRCMRAGFLTTASQPGRPFAPGHDGRGWGQRAFVCGFARAATLARLRGEAQAAGLWCRGSDDDAAPCAAEVWPVGLADGEPYLFAGHAARAEELALFSDELAPEAQAELSAVPFVWLVDPVWGRRAALPHVIERALGAADPLGETRANVATRPPYA